MQKTQKENGKKTPQTTLKIPFQTKRATQQIHG
jgi:hypothetical protein